MTDAELIRRAAEVTRPRALGKTVEAGAVGAAIEAGSGEVFCGVSIDAACGIGFCAEHGAVAAMITAGGSRVLAMVAVHAAGHVVAPCGRCRELVMQIDPANTATRVLLPGERVLTLAQLLPDWWQSETQP